MYNRKLLVSSHAPFWHDGSSITLKNYNIMLATLPAVIFGIIQYGAPALGVLALSVSCAMLWELLMSLLMKRPVSIGDGSAALIGLLFGMLMPAATPWWATQSRTTAMGCFSTRAEAIRWPATPLRQTIFGASV